jgi:hypothetical protein
VPRRRTQRVPIERQRRRDNSNHPPIVPPPSLPVHSTQSRKPL